MRILALDFEGSHKNPRQGCPVQLGVAVMEDGHVTADAEWLIQPPVHWKTGKPTREVDAYALRISGLSLETIEAEGLTSCRVCEMFKEWVVQHDACNLTVIAFNFTYDAEAYSQLLYDGGYFSRYTYPGKYIGYPEILGPKWICAYRWARRSLASQLDEFSLDAVASHFGFAREGEHHGAKMDAILAGQVFFALAGNRFSQGVA